MSLSNELLTLLQGRAGRVTTISANHYRFAPNDNVCVIDITFDDQNIHLVGRDISDNEISVSIRKPNEELIQRIDIALNAIIEPMRRLRDLINPPR